jgi:hypothetical protein
MRKIETKEKDNIMSDVSKIVIRAINLKQKILGEFRPIADCWL